MKLHWADGCGVGLGFGGGVEGGGCIYLAAASVHSAVQVDKVLAEGRQQLTTISFALRASRGLTRQ